MAKKEAASTAMLVLALLKQGEMYGYQIIEELDRRSEHPAVLRRDGEGPVGFGGEGAGVVDLLQGGDGHPGRSVRRP